MDRYEKSIENKHEVKAIDICQFWFIFTTHHNFNPFFALRLSITQISWAQITEQKEENEEKASVETKRNLGKLNENPM